MTKEQLEAENERLGAEVAALRDLLTVIAGGNPPMYAVPGNHRDGWLQTGHDRLVAATGAAEHAMRHAGTDGFTMTLRAMSGYLRHEFDRPLGYEPKAAEPAPADPADHDYVTPAMRDRRDKADEAWRLTPKGIEAAAAVIPECGAVDDGWHCTEGAGHAPADHLARVDVDGPVRHRWPAAPVIADSERDCGERNPDGSGEPCHRGGDHGVHRDSNGDEWRADGDGGVLLPAACDPDSAPEVTA